MFTSVVRTCLGRYLSHVPYRLIFVIASLALVLISLLDLVFVLRLHLHLGISDRIFAIGDNAVAPIARRFYTMPMFVLAAKLCPPGMEATLFASIMVQHIQLSWQHFGLG